MEQYVSSEVGCYIELVSIEIIALLFFEVIHIHNYDYIL